jgi:hypothetical protein
MAFRGKLVGSGDVVTVQADGDKITSVDAAEIDGAIGGDDGH